MIFFYAGYCGYMYAGARLVLCGRSLAAASIFLCTDSFELCYGLNKLYTASEGYTGNHKPEGQAVVTRAQRALLWPEYDESSQAFPELSSNVFRMRIMKMYDIWYIMTWYRI